MKLYLAGKMTGLPRWGFDQFELYATLLRQDGYDIVSPHEIDLENGFDPDLQKEFSEEDFEKAILRDYAAILKCDGIVFMPNAHLSRGATLEREFGRKLGKKFYHAMLTKSPNDDIGVEVFNEQIIGIAGKKRSGKDTVAKIIESNFQDSVVIKHLADPMRKICQILGDYFSLKDGDLILGDALQKHDWEYVKTEYPAARKILQLLGTEGGRESLWEDVWVDACFNKFPVFDNKIYPITVIPDVRFANEAKAIRRMGGFVLGINRPGLDSGDQHASEKIDFDVDIEINNDGSIMDLERNMGGVIMELRENFKR
jgi:hypothetical protein